MRKSNRLAFVYLIIGVAFLFGWQYVQNQIWPPPPKVQKAKPEEVLAMVAGTPAIAANEIDIPGEIAKEKKRQFPDIFGTLAGSHVTAAIAIDAPGLVAAERRKAIVKAPTPSKLIAMGKGEKPFHIQALLNTRGASVQQVVLSDFQEADREGLPVWEKDDNGKDRVGANGKKVARPLHLIPGVRVPRTEKIRDQRDVKTPELAAGLVTLTDEEIEHASYVMYHYQKESDVAPVDTLGERIWEIVRDKPSSDGNSHVVVFETTLESPFYIKITKTYTLYRSDYHIGLSVSIAPWERPPGVKAEPFRYQIDGPRAMPIEGEWYTSVYRQGIVGYPDSRALEEPRTVRHQLGSDPYRGTDKKPVRYAGIMIQYFASVLATDNEQPGSQSRDYIDYIRFTPEGPAHKNDEKKLDQTFLDDMTFRAVIKPIDPTVAITHPYVLYQGPVKVRLLKQLKDSQEVPEATVDRYKDDLHLNTMTDSPMPNWIGRFANAIFWTDIVILFTNVIHYLLGLLSQVVPNLGICIIIITVCVRALLHPFSRRQMINAKKMQAKQEKLAPELKKLTEKYGDDFNKLNQEKMKLYREHGINPAAAMGGCVLLLMQMPIFMGLYFALQESVFFRLESLFGDSWIPNLAAPDMLVWWTENIPWISKPEDLGNTLYLGPYLNLLPIISVALMMYVQSKLMPKSEDPQIQMQQKTMKIMMIIMLFFFYKVAAGLCIYFIVSSLWGMVERKLIPKNVTLPEDPPPGGGSGPKDRDRPKPTEPKGWLGKKMAGWRERWSKILEDAQKQQQLQREQRPGQQPGQQPQPGQGKKKKKRR